MSHPVRKAFWILSFGGYTKRTGRSFAYYRAPYWRRDVADADFITRSEDFIGYQPTFETLIKDHINAVGLKFDLGGDWKGDASLTYGANSVFYTVNNSVNRDYLKDHGTSPRTFHPGGYRLQNVIENLDFSGSLSEDVSMALGMEYKKNILTLTKVTHFLITKGGQIHLQVLNPQKLALGIEITLPLMHS